MRHCLKAVYFSYLLMLALTQMSIQAFVAPSYAAESASTANIPTESNLKVALADRLQRVEEFKFIEAEAAKLGVRAWLFGGTAAGYAHYVKWDLQRENGDQRFQPDRFDYDYTNIYRSTQDLDIVIDGTAEQAQSLQNVLAEKFPHLQGSKSAWEVRLLTQDMADKLAILNNPDFMNQHTDSNSTGLVEITKPKQGEAIIRDVRSWNSKEPFFLKDVYEGKLHYYFSPLHETTRFAKEGRNPPILSAIRYLTKAFQYELNLRSEDLAQIKKVIDEFDPKRDTQNPYVANWIEKNGKKLIQNAVNIEYAWDTLEKLGLRSKLAAIQNGTRGVESLAWWMNKEPLRSKILGEGTGKTARELGLDVVAHETSNFLAYESITRAHTGDPNVLISRSGTISGETATYGDGFYTKIGREGARGTGLTIRFHLNPNAREGSDFVLVPSTDFVVVQNKSALKVIPESLNIGPVEYFQMLLSDDLLADQSQLGLREKLKRRLSSKALVLSEKEEKNLLKLMKQEISNVDPNVTAIDSIFEIYPHLKKKIDSESALRFQKIAAEKFHSAVEGDKTILTWAKYIDDSAALGILSDFLNTKEIRKKYSLTQGEAILAIIKNSSDESIEKHYSVVEKFLIASPDSFTAGDKEKAAQLVIQRMSQVRPESLNRLLREGPLHLRKYATYRLVEKQPTSDWVKRDLLGFLKSENHDDRLIGMYQASRLGLSAADDRVVFEYLQSTNDREVEGAMNYFEELAKAGDLRPEIQPEVLKIVKTWDRKREHIDGHWNAAAHHANTFLEKQTEWRPAVIEELISELNSITGDQEKREYVGKYRRFLLQIVKTHPELIDRIHDFDLLADVDCKTQRCIDIYVKTLNDPITRQSSASILRGIQLDKIEKLTRPLPNELIEAVGQYVFDPKPSSYLREKASFLYAQLDGQNLQTITRAIHFLENEYFLYRKQNPGDLQTQLLHKLKSACVQAQLREAL